MALVKPSTGTAPDTIPAALDELYGNDFYLDQRITAVVGTLSQAATAGFGLTSGTVADGGALAAETTRAKAAESANATAIGAETTRAQAAEAALQAAVSQTSTAYSVNYTPQSLNAGQQATARGNIGAAASGDVVILGGGSTVASTPAAGDSTLKVATTAFSTGAITSFAATVSATYITQAAAAATYALLASPAFTGTPTVPTAPVGTNTTQAASTAFVLANGTQTNKTVAAFNDTRTLAILQAKQMSGVARLYSGFADGYAAQDGVDLANSTGVFVDTTGKQLVGGVGGPAFVIENTPSLPKMVSNIATATGATGYVVSASAVANSGQDAWYAFNGTGGDGWAAGAGNPQWVQLKAPSAIKLAGYAITGWYTSATNSPTAWQFQGSNDGTSWTTLDTQTGQSIGASVRAVYAIPAANQGSYTYHRLNVTASAANVGVTELELLQYTPAFESHPSLPAMTSNTTTATGETGHTAFASNEVTNGGAWNAFRAGNGGTQTSINGNANTVWTAGLANPFPQFVGRITPNPIKIGGYAVAGWFDGTNNFYPTSWRVEASNTGNTTDWTVLDTRTNVPFTGGQRQVFNIPAGNQGAYRYHRLVVTAQVSNGSGAQVGIFDLLQVLTGIEGQTSIPYHTGPNTVVGGASGYAVSANLVNGAGFEAYRAADGNRPISVASGQIWNTGNSNPATWQRQFPAAIKVLAYRLASLTPSYSPLSWTLRGSNTNNGTDWVTLDSRTVGTNFWSSNYGDWSYFAVQSPGSYLYYQMSITSVPSGAAVNIGEVEFLQGTSGNMDLRSVSAALGFTPTKASIFIPYKVNAGSVTLNTNLVASLSRDGTTWTPVTLTQGNAWNGYQTVMADGVDLSGTNTGTALKYRLQTTDGALGLSLGGVDLRSN